MTSHPTAPTGPSVSTGTLRTKVLVHRQPEPRRIDIALQFVHRPVTVSYSLLRDGSRTVTGFVALVATVDHGTCTAVLVLTNVETQPLVSGVERLPLAIPLSQISDIITIGA